MEKSSFLSNHFNYKCWNIFVEFFIPSAAKKILPTLALTFCIIQRLIKNMDLLGSALHMKDTLYPAGIFQKLILF